MTVGPRKLECKRIQVEFEHAEIIAEPVAAMTADHAEVARLVTSNDQAQAGAGSQSRY